MCSYLANFKYVIPTEFFYLLWTRQLSDTNCSVLPCTASHNIQAVKPASSRSQSAEIFVVGRNYKAPDYIDPRMLDPRHAFQQDYEAEGSLFSINCL